MSFDAFAPCGTGPAILYNPASLPPGCTLVPDVGGIIRADYDRDGDVDQDDFGTWQRCLGTAVALPDPNCTN